MFAKQKFRTSYVYKTKQNKEFRDKLCLQNKQMFTKQKNTDKLCLQNKTKVCKHVLFIKENKSLQKKIQRFTNTLCLQNETNVYNTNVYKIKVYKHVMFTKRNTKQKVYKTKLMFRNTLCLQNTKVYKHVMFTKQKKRLQNKCLQW